MILLVYPQNSPFYFHRCTPLSIIALGSYLESKGIEVEYFDERIHPRKRFESLVLKKPEAIGISSMTSFQIASALRLAKAARSLDRAVPLVWGGVHPTMMTDQTLMSPYVDYIIKHEGEEGLHEFVLWSRGQGGRHLREIKGLCFKGKDGGAVENQERPFLDLDALPDPYGGKAAALLGEYLAQKHPLPAVAVELSRGCPYRCAFCYSAFFNRGVTRIKSLEKIRGELRSLREDFAVKRIQFCDDTLCGGSPERIVGLCGLAKELDISWEASASPNVIDERMVAALENGNCESLFFGLESGDEDILKKLGKGSDARKNGRAVHLMSRSRIDATYSLISGHPWETERVYHETLDYADALHKIHPSAGIAVQPYLPLPGTKMYEEALRSGFAPPGELADWADYTHDQDISVPWLSRRRSKGLKAVYLTTFLAFRLQRQMPDSIFSAAYRVLRRISLWRWERRFFGLYFEGFLFDVYRRIGRLSMLLERKGAFFARAEAPNPRTRG